MRRSALTLAFVSLGLAACAGGGGGGGSDGGVVTPPPTPPTLARWTDKLKAGAAVVVAGRGVDLTFTQSNSAPPGTASPVGDVTLTQTLGGNAETIGLKLVTAGQTDTLAAANGDTFVASPRGSPLVIATAANETRRAVMADPLKLGWNYQTFAVWRTGISVFGIPSTTSPMSAVSVGETTQGAFVPTTGSAIFRGIAVAYYMNQFNPPSTLEAPLTINANFANRSLYLTTGSFHDVTAAWYDFGAQGLQGTLTYSPTANALSGAIRSTDDGRMTGTATAQFYGPQAEEIGGQFSLSGPTDYRMIGAFGAARSGFAAGGPAFTSWSMARLPGATTSVSGQAVQRSYTLEGGRVTSIIDTPASDATYTEGLDSTGAIASVKVTAGGRDLTFSTAAGDTIRRGRTLTLGSANGSATAAVADPTLMGFDYQSYGAWETGLTATSSNSGAFSVGSQTAGSAIPVTGQATFTGSATSIYVNADGIVRPFTTDMTFTANFAARAGVLKVEPFVYGMFPYPTLQPGFTATLTYQAGANQLTGIAETADGRLTGPAAARFFGPAAEEVGGLFSLAPPAGSASAERLQGAFGAKR